MPKGDVSQREISRTGSVVTYEGRKQAFENTKAKEEIEARQIDLAINEENRLRNTEMTKTQNEKVEDAKELVAADAKLKAEAAAKEAAKAQKEAEDAERAAKTPEQRLQADWPEKHKELATYITALGEVRGGLLIPDQKKAKNILKSYGFKVFKESGSKRRF